jgi:hypothetical protein
MTKFSNATIAAASNVNLTADRLTAEINRYDLSDLSQREINKVARNVATEFAAADGVETLPEIGFRGARSAEAYSGVAGSKDVPVFMGRRTIVASGVLHPDGSLTVNGETHQSPSRAHRAVNTARGIKFAKRSGWVVWLYIDANGNVRPIEALREGGVQQRRNRTKTVRTIETAKDVRTFKAIARREAKGTVTAPGQWAVDAE